MNEDKTSKETSKEMSAKLDQLRALRDEVRVKAHLGKMEAKQRWQELEPRINATVEQAEKTTAEKSRAVVDEAIKALEKLRVSI